MKGGGVGVQQDRQCGRTVHGSAAAHGGVAAVEPAIIHTPCCSCVCVLIFCSCAAGLRSLQGRKQLHDLVSFVKTARDNLDWGPSGPPPLLVKVAPDLTDADKADIAAVILDTGVDGLVVSNTTISRPGLWGATAWQAGSVRRLAGCMASTRQACLCGHGSVAGVASLLAHEPGMVEVCARRRPQECHAVPRCAAAEVVELANGQETGGLSGPPLMALSTQALSDLYRLTGGKVPIIGCGGVASGEHVAAGDTAAGCVERGSCRYGGSSSRCLCGVRYICTPAASMQCPPSYLRPKDASR